MGHIHAHKTRMLPPLVPIAKPMKKKANVRPRPFDAQHRRTYCQAAVCMHKSSGYKGQCRSDCCICRCGKHICSRACMDTHQMRCVAMHAPLGTPATQAATTAELRPAQRTHALPTRPACNPTPAVPVAAAVPRKVLDLSACSPSPGVLRFDPLYSSGMEHGKAPASHDELRAACRLVEQPAEQPCAGAVGREGQPRMQRTRILECSRHHMSTCLSPCACTVPMDAILVPAPCTAVHSGLASSAAQPFAAATVREAAAPAVPACALSWGSSSTSAAHTIAGVSHPAVDIQTRLKNLCNPRPFKA